MKWFRFYSEALEDPKVQKLSPELFKFWVNILCITSKHDGKLPPIEDIAFAFRLTLDETKVAFHGIQKAHLIDENTNQYGTTWAPHNWNKRQYKSDTSTERVKRFRNAARNNIETPPDTDSDTDTEQSKKSKPKKKKLPLAELSVDHVKDWLAGKRLLGKYLTTDEHHVLDQFKNYCESKGKKYENYVAGYRNAFEWDRCQPKAGFSNQNKHQRTLEAAARGHMRAENPDF